MKASLNDATHYNERTDEYWLLEDGVYYLYLNGFGKWQDLNLMGWWNCEYFKFI